jgi:IS1 family transposase
MTASIKVILIKVLTSVVMALSKRHIREKLPQSVSHTINTAYIEQSNGTLRQMDAHLRRKSLTFAKKNHTLKPG